MANLSQRLTAEHMVEAVGYLISVAARWQLPRVVSRLDQVRVELLLVVSKEAIGTSCDDVLLPPKHRELS